MAETPQATLHTLSHADGSATYTHENYSILATVNGPIEVQRRDELPEEIHLEVNVRPASGGGSPRDRLLESLLQRTFLGLIDRRAHPRSLVQLTLQIVRTPADLVSVSPPHQSDSILPLLPSLVNAGMLALASGNIPLLAICAATEIESGNVTHVFGFTSHGELLLAESEGIFELQSWSNAEKKGKAGCEGLITWMKGIFEADLMEKTRWRGQD